MWQIIFIVLHIIIYCITFNSRMWERYISIRKGNKVLKNVAAINPRCARHLFILDWRILQYAECRTLRKFAVIVHGLLLFCSLTVNLNLKNDQNWYYFITVEMIIEIHHDIIKLYDL